MQVWSQSFWGNSLGFLDASKKTWYGTHGCLPECWERKGHGTGTGRALKKQLPAPKPRGAQERPRGAKRKPQSTPSGAKRGAKKAQYQNIYPACAQKPTSYQANAPRILTYGAFVFKALTWCGLSIWLAITNRPSPICIWNGGCRPYFAME